MKQIMTILFALAGLVACEKSSTQDPQERDREQLSDMLKDIHETVDTVDCVDDSQWEFTAIGSKACGGPQSYLAYPLSIDTAEFMGRVRLYTQAEQDYNVTYKITSTCDVVAPPTDVTCDDGKPKLIYRNLAKSAPL